MPAQNPDRHRFLIRKFRSFAELRRVARKQNIRALNAADWEQHHSRPVYASPDEAPWHFPARIEAAEQRKSAAAKRSK